MELKNAYFVWFLSLDICMWDSSMSVCVEVRCRWLIFCCYTVFHCMNKPRFIYPSHIEYLDCFQFGIIKNSAAVNVLEMFLHAPICSLFWVMYLKVKVLGCRGYLLQQLQVPLSHSACPNLHSHQHCMRVSGTHILANTWYY